MPGVEHDGVFPVVLAHQDGRRRDGRGGPARAVPAGVPDRPRAGLVPQHRGLRQASWPANWWDQLTTRLAV